MRLRLIVDHFDMYEEKIKEFSEFFLKESKKWNEISQKCDEEIKKAKQENEAYVKDFVKRQVETYQKYRDSTIEVLVKLENAKIRGVEGNPQEATFPSLDAAHKFLYENLEKLDNFNKQLDEYSFKPSKYSDMSFDGETAKIEGKEYAATDIPELNEEDFDSDEEYVKLAYDTFQCGLEIIACLDFIIRYYSNDYIKEVVDIKLKEANKKVEQEINEKWDKEREETRNKVTDYYQNTVLQFVNENSTPKVAAMNLNNLVMPETFNKLIHIGYAKYKFTHVDEYKEMLKDIDVEHIVENELSLPIYIDLSENGNVIINRSSKLRDTGKKEVFDFVNQLIMQYISAVPVKKMNLALIDLDTTDDFDFVASYNKEYLKNNNLLFSGKPITKEEDFGKLLDDLIEKINEVKGDRLSPKDCENIYQYNELSPENTQEMYLLVYANCPKGLNRSYLDKIYDLAINGNRCGIFTIILDDPDYPLPEDARYSDELSIDEFDQFIVKLEEKSIEFNGLDWGLDYQSKRSFTPADSFKAKDTNEFFRRINEISKEQSAVASILPLDKLLKNDYARKPYYDQIKIPVGKEGGDTVYLELNIGGSGTSSAIIAGGTGSGKTSFLHTIILSGAYNYSPDELEFYLIDFKDGVEFSPYRDSMRIPHIAFLSLQNKVEDASDILSKIYSEKEYRNKCFTKLGVADIRSYQQHPDVISGKMPSFKRTVVIIDEYQNFLDAASDSRNISLCNKCAGLLLKCLKEIRNVGISIVLASQGISVEKEALDQIYNRFIFNSSSMTLQVAFPEFVGDQMNVELNKEKGLCYKTSTGGTSKTLFKAAWSGETNKEQQKSIIHSINDKWSSFEAKEPVVSGCEDPLPIYESSAPFVRFEKMEQNEDYTIPTYFGQSALSSELSIVEFKDSDYSNYLILGEIKKVRGIEASIGLSFLYAIKQFDYSLDKSCLVYLDLNNSNDSTRNPSPFDIYKDELSEVMTYAFEEEEIISSINNLYNDYLARKEASKRRSREIQVPKLLIVNSFSYIYEIEEVASSVDTSGGDDYNVMSELNDLAGGDDSYSPSLDTSNKSLSEKIIELYENGYTYNIYVVIHDRRMSSLQKNERFGHFHRVICCDKDESINCTVSENGDSITITELPNSYALLYPQVSKVRPFTYDKSEKTKEFIDKLVEEIK